MEKVRKISQLQRKEKLRRKMNVKGSWMDKRYGASKSSSASSISRSKVCGCGEELICIKSKTVNNPGRMFWRCHNWNKDDGCNYFRWADDDIVEQSVKGVGGQSQEQELEVLRKKIGKLHKKLGAERCRVQFCGYVVFFMLAVTCGACVFASMKCGGVG
ncbi:Zinc finger, GRF-type [Sesbania bispinosa]|nr:Zinc finger, GRF-type [Sesbania bispinosa]